MKVEQLMTRDVKSCRSDQSLNCAAQMMWENDCGCAPVVNDEGEVIGMITDRDICMAAYTQNRPLTEISVGECMAREVFGCSPGESIETAEAIMQHHQLHRLPVMSLNRQLVGILSLSDLARAAGRHRNNGNGVNAISVEATFAEVCRPRLPHLIHSAP